MERPNFEERRRQQVKMPMLILGSVMIVIYFGLGITFLLYPKFTPNFLKDFGQIFGIMLLVYSTYRAWRLYADYYK